MNRSVEAEIAKFNRDYTAYARDGLSPFQTYQDMCAKGFRGVDIAIHFGVSQGTVSIWSKRFNPKVDSLSS